MTRKRPTRGASQCGAERRASRGAASSLRRPRALGEEAREIAETKRRYGYPRIYVRLRREGGRVNHKKVARIYREGR